MNIGQAAQASGITAKMIRHYEEMGLLVPPERTASGYRQYGERELSILRFIRQARALGFSLTRIGELIGLWSDSGRASREVKAVAARHLAELDDKLQELQAMKRTLETLYAACPGDDAPRCAILQDLASLSPLTPEPKQAIRRTRRGERA
ncbi:MAG: Cu(I)-responsive transcriptional regulator [Gammaproteobacteria bacterium]|nr:Cu(I)-responsive transcriptional regulator [Gammaproteobacteria bacterium]